MATTLNVVMVHGLGAGLAMFAMNYGALSRGGPVYALDLPGFARSSRPHFSADPLLAEEEYVQCLENWRHSLGLDKIHLLGTYSTRVTLERRNTENSRQIFPGKELRGYSPKSYIQVSVSDLDIALIGLPQKVRITITVCVPISRQRECPSSHNREWGGGHSHAGEGLGESQFRRLEKKLSTLPTLWSAYSAAGK
jgi:hypothetical protein